jgi:dienelactone hydrolase
MKLMSRTALVTALTLLVLSILARSMTPEQRREYRENLLKILPDSPPFKEWISKTDALPPDFDALPKHNNLPEPLAFMSGKPVRTPQDWRQRRKEVRELFEKYEFGAIPPKPALGKIMVANETKAEGCWTRTVQLDYGPDNKLNMSVTITVPSGDGPFPVLIGGQPDVVVRRGYIACSYPTNVDTVTKIPAAYPDYDFATIAQVAWSAQVVVDYLNTLRQVDKKRIAITGYSRAGKMALTAAAIDDRIAAVLAGSTGVGGVTPWRLSGERGMGEGIESTTRMFPLWYAARFRFFSGREDRLPVDGNLLVAMVAPRACLMQYGLNDEVSNTGQNEKSYRSALKVYKLLGKPDSLGLLRNPGFHQTGMDMEVALDWLDIQFGRSMRVWHNDLLFPWEWNEWAKFSGEKVDLRSFPYHKEDLQSSTKEQWQAKAAEILKQVNWMLGDEPLTVASGRGGFGGFGGARGGQGSGARGPQGPDPAQLGPDVPGWVRSRASGEFGWSKQQSAGVAMRPFYFAGIRGDLYYPEGVSEGARLPAVVWLHGYSYPLGYMWVYRRDTHPVLALAKSGYAVLAFDQSGFGSRMNEDAPFYSRFPRWSRLGKMVSDTKAAITALSSDPMVDSNKIGLFGYSLGGIVALHVAALDNRVKCVAAICAFTPMRTDTNDKGTGGVARYSHENGIIPRVGFFIGNESKIPYDYDELLATIAPRPVYVYSPQLNRDATAEDVAKAVASARKIYGLFHAGDNLALDQPWDYHRLSEKTQDQIIEWMNKRMK